MRLFSQELLLNAGGGGKFDPITFNVGGSTTEWVVPSGIKQVRVECVASAGQGISGKYGGKGGKVTCILNVNKTKSFFITVAADRKVVVGGYNSSYISTVKNSMENRIIVAGGGGDGEYGGNGGGTIGENASYSRYLPGYNEWDAYCGHGGTQTAGGAGPSYAASGGQSGSFGYGGSPNGNRGEHFQLPGTGANYQTSDGGDGWYGGGSGSGAFTGKGGGGSSYTHPTLCSEVTHVQGFNADTTGWVTISMV